MTLDVDPVSSAAKNGAVGDVSDVLGQRLDHHASALEVREGAVLYERVSVDC